MNVFVNWIEFKWIDLTDQFNASLLEKSINFLLTLHDFNVVQDKLFLFMSSAADNLCNTVEHGCEHQCVSTPGSYHCICPEGHVLQDDGKTCGSKERFHSDDPYLFILNISLKGEIPKAEFLKLEKFL